MVAYQENLVKFEQGADFSRAKNSLKGKKILAVAKLRPESSKDDLYVGRLR